MAMVPALLTSTSRRPANRPPKSPVQLRDERGRPLVTAEVRAHGLGVAARLLDLTDHGFRFLTAGTIMDQDRRAVFERDGGRRRNQCCRRHR